MTAKLEVPKGTRYFRLTIIREVKPHIQPSGQKCRRFKTRCDCGTVKNFLLLHLKHGRVKSCGCLRNEILEENRPPSTHGYALHPLYDTYRNMLNRCQNEDHQDYDNYGGRGISVCRSWREDIGAFIKWAESNGWKPRLEIDRRDNNKGYKPSNCRWVTRKKNSRNKRNNKRVVIEGKSLAFSEAVERYAVEGVNYDLAYYRFQSGWELLAALTTPR